MNIDRLDLRILSCLQQDGRMSTARLAERIGLTPSPTFKRIRGLEETGLLRGYRAELAVECLPPLARLIVSVSLANHRMQDFRDFEAAVARAPEVVACWAVGGDVDYMLHLVVANADAAQGRETLETILGTDLGISKCRTQPVGRSIKSYVGLPLEQLIGAYALDDKPPLCPKAII
jgi:Lrp/AsnC family transcriptional regulator of ectoine degradation